MDPKQFRRRIWAVAVALALILTGMGSTLYDLQINQGEEYYQRSQRKIAETQTVDSDRGDILDRNGRILVSNRVVYQVTLDLSLMGKAAERNAALLELVQIARQSGVEWNDSLPISADAPFSFTTDSPYFTISQTEDGTISKSLTRLGQLAVKMKWLSFDPTEEPKPVETAPVQKDTPGLWERIRSFFTGEATQEPAPPPTEEPDTSLPTARQLLGAICASFEIRGENAVDSKTAEAAGQTVPELNIGNMDPADARAIAGLLYELYLRSREVTWTPYIFAEDVDIDFISRVKEHGLPGVVIEPTTVRQYHTQYAAHLLGRVGKMSQSEVEYYTSLDEDGDGKSDYEMDDTVGKEGVEKAFESFLRGTPGTRTVERSRSENGRGSGKIIAENWISPPKPGDNLVLTLDIDLQKKVEDTLASSLPNLASEEVEGAACVILDVENFDVLASASYPTFDLANYSRDWEKNSTDPLSPLMNRALQGTYPPGSTFKMVTAIGALEEEIITPTSRIRDLGRYTYYPGVPPQCWYYRQYGRYHGLIDVSEAIEVSCNYFFYDIGRRLGIDRLVDYATAFGLGQKTGIELEEKAGVMAGPEYTESRGGTWYEGSVLSVAIGQESSQFTPIQLASYIATLVNGGTRKATHLLKETKSCDYTQIVETYEPEILSTIEIQDENLNAVKAGMLALTTKGSVSRYFQDLPVQVGAKTGSAQVSAQTESNAVFVCFAPYDDPEIALAMVVEHGGSGSELGAMAADILSYYFSTQGSVDEIPAENTLVR